MALLSLPNANNLNLNLVAFSSKPLSLSSSSKPQSLVHLPHHHYNYNNNSKVRKNHCSGFISFDPVLNNSAPRSRPSLKTSFSFQGSPLSSSNDDEQSSQNAAASERRPDQNQIPSFRALTKAYKEALLIRDMETAAEIESIMYAAENEKNELVEKVSALSTEITSGKEKYIRLQADFDNFRKRSEKEKLTIRSDAQGEVIESLLPMVDNFERAKQQIKPETEMEKKINVSYQGIYKQFVEIMRSLRVSAVATVGKPFDPSLHEAIAREESQEFKAGIITQEFRRGFILGGRLLRPAMVKVSSGPGPEKTPPPASEKSSGKFATASVDE